MSFVCGFFPIKLFWFDPTWFIIHNDIDDNHDEFLLLIVILMPERVELIGRIDDSKNLIKILSWKLKSMHPELFHQQSLPRENFFH